MTKADQFEALALLCEQVTGADRELDLSIYLACYPESNLARWVKEHRRGFDGNYGFAWELRDTVVLFEGRNERGDCFHNGGVPLPQYTASLDAAHTIDTGALVVFASDIGADGLPMVKVVNNTSTSPVLEHTGIARTLELAWCAAALRARAQMERGE